MIARAELGRARHATFSSRASSIRIHDRPRNTEGNPLISGLLRAGPHWGASMRTVWWPSLWQSDNHSGESTEEWSLSDLSSSSAVLSDPQRSPSGPLARTTGRDPPSGPPAACRPGRTSRLVRQGEEGAREAVSTLVMRLARPAHLDSASGCRGWARGGTRC